MQNIHLIYNILQQLTTSIKYVVTILLNAQYATTNKQFAIPQKRQYSFRVFLTLNKNKDSNSFCKVIQIFDVIYFHKKLLDAFWKKIFDVRNKCLSKMKLVLRYRVFFWLYACHSNPRIEETANMSLFLCHFQHFGFHFFSECHELFFL